MQAACMPICAKYVGVYAQSRHVCCWLPRDLLDSVISRIKAACMREIRRRICARLVGQCDLAHTGCLYARNISENMREITLSDQSLAHTGSPYARNLSDSMYNLTHAGCLYPPDVSDSVISRMQAARMREICRTICIISHMQATCISETCQTV